MGSTKRKVKKANSTTAKQTAGKERMHSTIDLDAHAKQGAVAENSEHPALNLVPRKKKASAPTNIELRRSVRVRSPVAGSKQVNTSNNVFPQTADEERLHSPTERDANDKQVVHSVHQKSNLLPRKKKTSMPRNVELRRSIRVSLQKPGLLAADSQRVQPILKHVNIVESTEGKEAGEGNQVSPFPAVIERKLEREAPQAEKPSVVLAVNERNVKENDYYIVQAVDDLNSQVAKRQEEDPCSEICNKTLHIESQKKMDKLMDDNFDLMRKIEATADKKMHSTTDLDAHAKQGAIVGNSEHQASNLIPRKKKASMPKNIVLRRSVCVGSLAAGSKQVNLFGSIGMSLRVEEKEQHKVKISNNVSPQTADADEDRLHSLAERDANDEQVGHSVHQGSNRLPRKKKTSMPRNVELRRSVRVSFRKLGSQLASDSQRYEKMLCTSKEVFGNAAQAMGSLSLQNVQRHVSPMFAGPANQKLSNKRKKNERKKEKKCCKKYFR